jgi:hypothetical protein
VRIVLIGCPALGFYSNHRNITVSNAKQIEIGGIIPFNCSEHAEMRQMLGLLNSPSLGLRIEYRPGPAVRNDTLPTFNPKRMPADGITSIYTFQIFGVEAISDSLIKRLLQAIVDCGGTLAKISVVDIDNQEKLKFNVPKPRQNNYGIYANVEVTSGELDESQAAKFVSLALSCGLNATRQPSGKDVCFNVGLSTIDPA